MELRTQPVGPYSMNAYVLVCPATKQSILIDPGDESDRLTAMLHDTKPNAIIVTHTHPDHVGALAEIKSLLQLPVMFHRGPHFEGFTLEADRWLSNGDIVPLGEHSLRIFHTPGHIADQICIAIQNDTRVIVGDTIFDGGPGKTHSVEDFQTMRKTLRDVILRWSEETVCYPGHGASFRLGDHRAEIEAFVRKDHGEFFGDATWGM
ncbi:MAG: MBL fold metallo-hydrolase [Chloroflexi bacterium]|nr:MBL fold metallo-hydrolase [Chloroflexota bacterium]